MSLKEKAIHESMQFGGISLYLALFFCAVATYRMLLLSDFQNAYFNYGASLINALVVAKVILIGEYAHLGRRAEDRPLLLSTFYKAFVFGLLLLAFHLVEEWIKQRLHGSTMVAAFHEMDFDELLGRALMTFCTFLPFFAFRELRRVLGEERFRSLFFHPRSGWSGETLT
jgi:hypothetical protein